MQQEEDETLKSSTTTCSEKTVCTNTQKHADPASPSSARILPQAVLLQADVFPATPKANLENGILRIATYNIHKGVRGVGPAKRAEHENLALAIEEFDADLIFLQEVRKLYNRNDISQEFKLEQPQADLLAPEGYISSYMTNAYNKTGQHGNALLSRWPVLDMAREDISNSRFEQRGLLHVKVMVAEHLLHCIVVHLSLMQSSRDWQLQKMVALIRNKIPKDEAILIAGDFNDWNDKLLGPMMNAGFKTFSPPPEPTFPSFAPMLRLDRVYARGLTPVDAYVPQGKIWARMSDHLPLMGEFKFDERMQK